VSGEQHNKKGCTMGESPREHLARLSFIVRFGETVTLDGMALGVRKFSEGVQGGRQKIGFPEFSGVGNMWRETEFITKC